LLYCHLQISQNPPANLLPASSSSSTSGGVASNTNAFSSLLDTPGYSLPPRQQQQSTTPMSGSQQETPSAMTLFEAPLSELRIPGELEVFPIAPGGNNIVSFIVTKLRISILKIISL